MARRTNYTFTDFYNSLVNNFTSAVSGTVTPFFGAGSRLGGIFKATAYIAEFLQLQINIAQNNVNAQRAIGLHKDYRVADFNLERKEPTNALAIQKFVGSTGRVDDVVIDAGTIVQTGIDLLGRVKQYETLQELILTTGSTSITGYVKCTVTGSIGNVLQSGLVTGLATEIAGIDSTYNIEAITNGSDLESDQELNLRIKKHILGLQKSNNSAVESAALSVAGVNYAKLKENSPTIGNFGLYISNETGIIDSITRQKVRNALSTAKGICITYSLITPIVSGVAISVDVTYRGENYNEETIIANIRNQIQDFVNKRKVNEIYISDIIYEIKYQNKYVSNVKNVTINGIASDLSLSEEYAIKVSNLTDITVNLTQEII